MNEQSSNFYGSLIRDRKDVSRAIAKDLALNAYEGWQDSVRGLDKKIREIKMALNAMRDAAYTDPLMMALKKNQAVDVDAELVSKRGNLLLELKDTIDARNVIARDRFFTIPAEEAIVADDELENVLYGRGDDEAVTAESADE
jgi:hypothetical protein